MPPQQAATDGKMQMNGAQGIVEALKENGINTLFGYPGGCIMPLYDALLDSGLTHVLCRHEQAAALAADGYARASGRLGVVVATSGPGATNLVTGVANAYMDSIPLLVITGQVPRSLIGTDAFQETDILGMTLGIVKHSYLPEKADQLPKMVEEAIQIATQGRPGPVWIDIPKDVLLEQQSPCFSMDQADQKCSKDFHPTNLDSDLPTAANLAIAKKLIQEARRPLIYSGGGVTLSESIHEFRQFASVTKIPLVSSLKGIGNSAKGSELELGMLGMHGSRAANEAAQGCDLLIAVGARFDDRATGNTDTFAPDAKIIHIDGDKSEIGKLMPVDCPLYGDMASILKSLAMPTSIPEWQNHCRSLKEDKSYFSTPSCDDLQPITGPEVISLLSQLAPSEAIVSCDVGQHQMWVAQYYDFNHPRQHLSSGGLGTMGFGLPAAIGAQLANPGAPVVNVTGDGSFMMNMQELATLQRYKLPVKIIILDNQRLGMVRQQQELFYGERYSEVDLFDNPAFTEISKAFGIHTLIINQRNQIRRGVETLFAYPGAMLLHISIEADSQVWPIVKPGSSNNDMIEESRKSNTSDKSKMGSKGKAA